MSRTDADHQKLVSEHLDHLLDLPEAARRAYLEALAAGEPEVARRLRQLLAAGGSVSFAAFLTDDPLAGSARGSVLIGKAVGPYVIDAEIGAGGMGTVWRAHRADGRFEGAVAIKFIHPAWLGGQGEQRFRREGRLLGRLDHPCIARLIDAGILDGRQPYLVLEHVDGVPIDDYCRDNALDRQARIALFTQVLDAVAHAHSHLIVHRDLKPSNVLVTREGSVKLLDFGIAKLLDDTEQPLTQASSRALTPQYAAPEQLNGRDVTTATDVYALGLMLYLLLSGTHPLVASSPTGIERSGAELMRAILTEDPPRLSSLVADRRALRRLMAGDLDNIVAKALKKPPDERYQSASAFAEDLRRFIAHEPVQARADTVTYRVTKFAIRHRGAVAGGLLVAAGLVSTSAFALWQMSEARTQRDLARSELHRAEAANDFSSLTLEQVGEGSKAMSREQLLDSDVQLLDARYGGDREFVADMLTQLAGRYGDAELNGKAMAVSARAVDLARASGNRSLLAMTMCEAAWQEILAPSHPHVDGWIDEAQRLLDASAQVPLRTAVSCLLAREAREQDRGNWQGAIALLRQAHELQVAEGLQSGLYYTTVLKELSSIYVGQGRYVEAFEAETEAGESLDRGGRGGTRGRAVVHQNLGTLLVYRGEPRAALVELEASRRTQNGVQSDDELMLPGRCVWAWALRRLGQRGRAERIIKGAAEELLAQQSPSLGAFTLIHDAALRFDAGATAEARQMVLKAIEVLAMNPELNASGLAQAEAQLAQIDIHEGRASQAASRLRDFLARRQYPRKPAAPILLPALLRAAEASLALGSMDSASAYSRDALAIASDLARGPDTSADVGEILTLQAQVLLAAHQKQEALRLLQRAVACFANALGEAAPRTQEVRTMIAEVSRA